MRDSLAADCMYLRACLRGCLLGPLPTTIYLSEEPDEPLPPRDEEDMKVVRHKLERTYELDDDEEEAERVQGSAPPFTDEVEDQLESEAAAASPHVFDPDVFQQEFDESETKRGGEPEQDDTPLFDPLQDSAGPQWSPGAGTTEEAVAAAIRTAKDELRKQVRMIKQHERERATATVREADPSSKVEKPEDTPEAMV
jgi:hypothetical protein